MLVHRQVGGDGSWIDRLRKGKPILSAGDGLNYFQFLSSRDAGIGFAEVHSDDQNASVRSTTSSTHRHGHGTNGTAPSPKRWASKPKSSMFPQETLIAIAPERFRGLSGNFGHTQIYTGAKLARDIPEFQLATPLVESVAENIAWMDKHSRVPDSDADDLEDRIIEAVRDLPTRLP